jgi:ectoine hydroxylase-related dioxygenase (phytanoyl-CoA dioxygenase family)
VHLDDSTTTNGPLRVLPGTHTLGVLTDDHMRELARSIDAVDCVAASGSVVAMRPLTVHASSKAADDEPRRVLHFEYAASTRVGQNLVLAEA